MKPYTKKALTIDEQIAKLESRGLIIPDRDKAAHYLRNISYYRLSAYMLAYQAKDGSHSFHPNTTFDSVLELYVFDRALRVFAFDAIERIEIALRTQLIHQMALQHGSHWQEDQKLFKDYWAFDALRKQISDACAQRKPEVFIKHYMDTYDPPLQPACWMSLEILTMGSLSRVFGALADTSNKTLVADHFKVSWSVMQSWMHMLTYVRNLCAHHSRLWNRELGIQPALLLKPKHPWIQPSYTNNRRMYYVLCCLRYLSLTINPSGSYTARLKVLMKKYPTVPYQYMGFPLDWEKEPLWLA
jgi:abortive infection bacteriophage resistance protein